MSKCEVNQANLKVFRLTKKCQDVSKLFYVNFKIEIVEKYANVIGEMGFWPPKCNIKPFVRKNVCNLKMNSNTNNGKNNTASIDDFQINSSSDFLSQARGMNPIH